MHSIVEILRERCPNATVNQPMAHTSFKPVAERLPRLPSLSFYHGVLPATLAWFP